MLDRLLNVAPVAAGGEGEGDLGAKRAYKAKFQEGVALFNKKPKKGVCVCMESGQEGPCSGS